MRALTHSVVVLLASGLAEPSASAGVLLHYTFDETFEDASGNGLDGFAVDNGVPNTAFVPSPAGFGSAWRHDDPFERDHVVYFADIELFDEAWSVSFWHQMGGLRSVPLFENDLGFHVFEISGLTWADVRFQSSSGIVDWSKPGIINGEFHHIVLVADPAGVDGVDTDGDGNEDNFALYVDNVLATPDFGALDDFETSIHSNSYGAGGVGQQSAGGISDELWWFDQALTPAQIASLYTSNDPCLDDSDGDGVLDCVDVCLGDDANGDPDGDGRCSLVLEAPADFVTGTPLDIAASGAPPGADIQLLVSTTGPGSPCHPTLDVCVDIAKPRALVRTVADAGGDATMSVTVPGPFAGRDISLQAVWILESDAEASNVLERTIQ